MEQMGLFEKINFWLFKVQFAAIRGQFYYDLACNMEEAEGANIKQLLKTQADRYPKGVIGGICRHWVFMLENKVGTFSQAIEGTVPITDQTLLRVVEENGGLEIGLKELGKNLLALQKTKSNILQLSALSALLMLILHVYVGAQAFYFLPETFSNIKSIVSIDKLGPTSQNTAFASDLIRSWGWLWIIFVATAIVACYLSMDRWTGKVRDWFDRYILPYQLYRYFNTALLLSTLGTITQKNGGTKSLTLKIGIDKVNQSSTPWIAYQTEKILNKLDEMPNGRGEIFNTGLLDKKVYFRILDLGEYTKDTSALLQRISETILEETPKSIERKIMLYRGVINIVIVGLMLGFYMITQTINDEVNLAFQATMN